MARGYPDYAAPYGEVLHPRGFIDAPMSITGEVAGSSYGDLYIGAVPEGYNFDVSMAVTSANGCEAYHLHALYVNAVLVKAYYFEVNIVVASPRYISMVSLDDLVARYYNYGDSARTFYVYLKGILITAGTEPLHPSSAPGLPPKLGKDETLFLVDSPWEGKIWRKVKNIPIPKSGWERNHPPLFLKGVK